MHIKFRIKAFKVSSKKNTNLGSFRVVVSDNVHRVNGLVYEKLGVFIRIGLNRVGYIDLGRLAYWVNRGAVLSTKVSWLVGMIMLGELGNEEI